MSLQTGEEIARTAQLVLSPTTLEIIGFELTGRHLVTQPSFLRIEDIRELSNIGFIVDSSDDISTLDDIITMRDIYELNFQLVNMKVIDTQEKKIGKVYDATFSTETFRIEQLCVARPFFKSFGDTELLIHRRQIKEITSDTIIVSAPTATVHTAHHANKPNLHVQFQDGNPLPQPETASRE